MLSSFVVLRRAICWLGFVIQRNCTSRENTSLQCKVSSCFIEPVIIGKQDQSFASLYSALSIKNLEEELDFQILMKHF